MIDLAEDLASNDDAETNEEPVWRVVAARCAQEFTYGQTVSREWVEDQFGIVAPSGAVSRRELERFEFLWLSLSRPFLRELLTRHKMLLVTNRQRGFSVVDPNEQHLFAQKQLLDEIEKAGRRAAEIMANVNEARRNDSARREGIALQNQQAQWSAMTRQTLKRTS